MAQRIISVFRGQDFFLSNFYRCPVTVNGLTYGSSEAAFQAQKCPPRASEFCQMDPAISKRHGRCVQLRSDWESVKEQVMYDVCMSKFTQNPDLATKLLSTGDATLIEGNNHGDREWGQVNGIGQNKLGRILMQIRDTLREQRIDP